ncbi:MAG: NAD(+) synthase [Oscillospiraceae bacterium]
MRYGFIKIGAATPKIKVAACKYNGQAILEEIMKAEALGVKVLVLPELCITGYTCGDLFLQKILIDGALEALMNICKNTIAINMLIVIGVPFMNKGKLYNCAAVLCNGKVLGVIPKTHLPNYGEFYEQRHFTPAPELNSTVKLGEQEVPFGTKLLFTCTEIPELCVATEICEDLWVANPPSNAHAEAGATIIVNPSASDEIIGKDDYRILLLKGQSSRLVCGYIYSDAGEGESTTDMVFAAHNLIAENGVILSESKPFGDGFTVSEIDVNRLMMERKRLNTYYSRNKNEYQRIKFSLNEVKTSLTRSIDKFPFIPFDTEIRKNRCEQILTIQYMGLKKRISHSKSKTLIIGISGGLDSSLALLVAVKAMDSLNKPRADIIAVTMPCFGTTNRTRNNAERLCECLGVTLRTIDISKAVKQHFFDISHKDEDYSIVFENSQARERTQILMDIANQLSGIVVGTGDLSELALGFATYNGDHMSMYAVNSSVPKTLIRHIITYIANAANDKSLGEVLLDIVNTPVSPELLPANEQEILQVTEQIVGPYELNDFFLYYAIRFGFSPDKVFYLAKIAFDRVYSSAEILICLQTFYKRFFSQQFKRSCMPDGPKVGLVTLSPRSDWRMPSDACAELWLECLSKLKDD